jgi:curved DNA-binding protein
MEFKDYYAVLGVERTADEDQIRRAYRKLARRYHPDVSKDPAAETKFRDVNEAYEVLKDPEKRKTYDRLGSRWRDGASSGRADESCWRAGFGFDDVSFATEGGSPSGFSTFFDVLFGRQRQRSRSGFDAAGPVGVDAEATIVLTLEEAARGGVRELHLQDPESAETTSLKVKIPTGVRGGQRIRIPGKGRSFVAGGPRGDLYLNVELSPHDRFRVDGDDLFTSCSVSPPQAVLGTVATVQTLDGPVRVKVPAGSSSGRKIRLRGRGLAKAGGGTGDLFVEIRVEVPKAISPRERELYEELAKISGRSSAAA